MAAPKGHKRYGGKQKGSKNKSTYEVKAIINSILPAKERYGLLAELAKGILVKQIEKDGEVRVYEKPPSEAALKILCEYADGKPVQTIGLPDDGDTITSVEFIVRHAAKTST